MDGKKGPYKSTSLTPLDFPQHTDVPTHRCEPTLPSPTPRTLGMLVTLVMPVESKLGSNKALCIGIMPVTSVISIESGVTNVPYVVHYVVANITNTSN